jgi:hypothetical protein
MTTARFVTSLVTLLCLTVIIIVMRSRAAGTSWKEQLSRSLFGAKNCPVCGTRMTASTGTCPNCRFPQP